MDNGEIINRIESQANNLVNNLRSPQKVEQLDQSVLGSSKHFELSKEAAFVEGYVQMGKFAISLLQGANDPVAPDTSEGQNNASSEGV